MDTFCGLMKKEVGRPCCQCQCRRTTWCSPCRGRSKPVMFQEDDDINLSVGRVYSMNMEFSFWCLPFKPISNCKFILALTASSKDVAAIAILLIPHDGRNSSSVLQDSASPADQPSHHPPCPVPWWSGTSWYYPAVVNNEIASAWMILLDTIGLIGISFITITKAGRKVRAPIWWNL